MKSSRRLIPIYTALLLTGWLVLMNMDLRSGLVAPRLRSTYTPLKVDEQLAIATRYAPFVLQAAHPERGRQDVPTRIDFDDDLRGDNNWDDLPFFPLLPTLYYSALETQTHWFLSYHLFYPRDWADLRLGLGDTHENDGCNLQLVVEKSSERPILLFTQDSDGGAVWVRPGLEIASSLVGGRLLLADPSGSSNPEGTHPIVLVGSRGHDLSGVDGHPDIELAPPRPTPRLSVPGWVLFPPLEGEQPREPKASEAAPGEAAPRVAYQLASTRETLWAGITDGSLLGFAQLFDDVVEYSDERLSVAFPLSYEADRFSGPLGPDRGRSPFALDFTHDPARLGALFFDPARRWPELAKVPEPWSRTYVTHPFSAD